MRRAMPSPESLHTLCWQNGVLAPSLQEEPLQATVSSSQTCSMQRAFGTQARCAANYLAGGTRNHLMGVAPAVCTRGCVLTEFTRARSEVLRVTNLG